MKNENEQSQDQPNLEVVQSGLKCDNPACDWRDDSITFENYKSCIDKPCPKCGENVLTKEDYINAEKLRLVADFVNILSKEDLEMLSELSEKKDIAEVFKGVKGADTLKPEGEILMTVSSHKQIKIEEVKNV